MNRALQRVVSLIAVALLPLAAGCAGSPRPHPETSARVKDSAPEKIAAQQAAARGLDLERDDERWGVEAARERRRIEDQKGQKAAAAAPTNSPTYIQQQSPSGSREP